MILTRLGSLTSVSPGAGRGQHSRPQHQYQTWERTSASSESSSSAADDDAAAREVAGAAEGAWREPFHLWPSDRRRQTVLGKEER